MKRIFSIALLFIGFTSFAQTANVLTKGGNIVTVPAGGGGSTTLPNKKIAIGNSANTVSYSTAQIDSATNTMTGLDSLKGISIIDFNNSISGSHWARIGVSTAPKFNFTFDRSYTNPDGTRDQVMQWGYNQNGGGGIADYRDSFSLHYAIENKYNGTIGLYQSEVHLQSNTPVSGNVRHFSYLINRQNGYTALDNQVDRVNWFHTANPGTSGTPFFTLAPDAGAVQINIPTPTFGILNTATGVQFGIGLNAGGDVNLTNGDGTSTTLGGMIFGTGNGTFAFNNSKTGAKLLELNPGNVSNFYGNGIRVKGAATAGLYLGTTNHADGYYWSMADAGNVMLQVAGPNYAYYNNGTAYDFTVGGFSKHALLIDNNGLVAVGGIINPIAGLHTTSFATRVIKVTANYTVGALIGTVYCTGTGGYTITFPPALANTDRIIAVSNSSTGIITLTGSYFIGGVSPTMAPGTSAVYHANEDSYWIKESEVAAGGGSSSVTVTATGDATGTSTTGSTPSLPLVLATVNSNTGPIGSATSIPIITLDAKGRATAATTATIPSLSTGTFTPTMGSSTLTSSVVATTAYYTKMGNFTRARITGTFTSTGTGLGGFSFTLPNSSSESASQIGVTAIGESSGNKPAAAVTSLSTSTSGYVQYTSTVAGSNTYVILLDYAN